MVEINQLRISAVQSHVAQPNNFAKGFITLLILGWHATSVVRADSFDTSNLVEVRTIGQLPQGVKTLLGRTEDGHNEIADVGEPFNATDAFDVYDRRPGRRFALAGVSSTRALVAYEQGGIGTYWAVDEFVKTDSGWVRRAQWGIRWRPRDLVELVGSVPATIK